MLRRTAMLALVGAIIACDGDGDGDARLIAAAAWVRAAPPAVAVQAGYLSLQNPSSRTAVIVAARSDAFGRVEIHESATRDGVTGMHRLDRLDIPAGAGVELEPGGPHLMLIDPERAFAIGERLEFVLELEDGSELRFSAEVRTDAP